MSRSEPEVFSLSAIDLFACSFGAVVLLMVIYVSDARKSDRDDEALLAVTFSVWQWQPGSAGLRVAVVVDGELLWPAATDNSSPAGRETSVEVTDASLPGAVDPSSGWRAAEVHEWTVAVRDHRGPRTIELTMQENTLDPDTPRFAGSGPAVRIDVHVATSTGPSTRQVFVLAGGRVPTIAQARAGDLVRLRVNAGAPGEEPPAEVQVRVTPQKEAPWPSDN